MDQVAEWMLKSINARNDEKALDTIRKEVVAFAREFPLPSDK
jgi:glycine/serine hydroxymethyltransferase